MVASASASSAVFVVVVVFVGVVGGGLGGGLGDLDEPQGAGQERGHLGSRDGLVGAVAPRLAGAACGDAGRGQGVDVGLVEVAGGVGEPGRVGGLEVERPLQERGHLGPVHRPVRAEPQRVDQAALGDLELGQPLDVGQPAVADVHVGEARLCCGGRLGLVEDPHQPNRHSPALHLIARTEHVLAALGPVEQPPLNQRINSRLMHAPSHVNKPATSLHSLHRRRARRRRVGPGGVPAGGVSAGEVSAGWAAAAGANPTTATATTTATTASRRTTARPYSTLTCLFDLSASGHHDPLHVSKTMDIVRIAFASRGSGSPHKSVLKGSEAPARWKPTLSY